MLFSNTIVTLACVKLWVILLCLLSDAQVELDSVEAELQSVEQQITELLEKQAQLTSRKNLLLEQLEEACITAGPSSSSSSSSSKSLVAEPVLSQLEMQLYDGTGSQQLHNKSFK